MLRVLDIVRLLDASERVACFALELLAGHAGHDGVVTCTTTPSPSSFQANTPFEWPHDPPQLLALQACTFGSW